MNYLLMAFPIAFLVSVGWHFGEFITITTVKAAQKYIRKLKKRNTNTKGIGKIFGKDESKNETKIKMGFQID